MKAMLLTISCLAALFFAHCVEGPVIVDEPGQQSVDTTMAVTSSDADSLLNAHRFGIIEFYSPHCAACKSLAWVIDSLDVELDDSIFVKMSNTDQDSLWRRFSISSVPTYVFFRDGEEIARRSFMENQPSVFDTLHTLLHDIIRGNHTPDTADTASAPDTTTPNNYIMLDAATFDTTVLRAGRIAMVFFLLPSGAPCIYMDSVVGEIAPLYDTKAVIAKVHAGEQVSLRQRYGIQSVPRFLFFKDSVLVEQRSGIIPGDTLTAILDGLLAPTTALQISNGAHFDTLVSEAGTISMINFSSPLCPACRVMNDTVDIVARLFDGRALIGKVNVDENDSLRRAHTVTSWPTFVFYDGGVEYERIVGVVPTDSLIAAVERGLTGAH